MVLRNEYNSINFNNVNKFNSEENSCKYNCKIGIE